MFMMNYFKMKDLERTHDNNYYIRQVAEYLAHYKRNITLTQSIDIINKRATFGGAFDFTYRELQDEHHKRVQSTILDHAFTVYGNGSISVGYYDTGFIISNIIGQQTMIVHAVSRIGFYLPESGYDLSWEQKTDGELSGRTKFCRDLFTLAATLKQFNIQEEDLT